MSDNKIDQQLERFSSAVAHASPDPLPLTEPAGRQRFKKPVLAFASGFVVVVLTVGISAVVVTWTRSADSNQQPAASTGGLEIENPQDQSGGLTSSLVATTETTASPEVVLWPYEPDPPLLYHPTVLPKGWEACRVIEDASKGDRFCDPQDPDEWVQVRVRRARDVRYDGLPPVGDDSYGVWVERSAFNEAAFRRGTSWIVVRNDDTLPAETLIEIAASIPVVGDFDSLYGAYEVPLVLEEISDDELAALLIEYDPEPRVVRRDLEANVYAGDVSVVWLYGFYADGYSVPDFAWQVPQPRLVGTPDDRPLIVGYSADKNRAYAVWDQAGYGWRLEERTTAEEIHDLAVDLINQISDLPTQ